MYVYVWVAFTWLHYRIGCGMQFPKNDPHYFGRVSWGHTIQISDLRRLLGCKTLSPALILKCVEIRNPIRNNDTLRRFNCCTSGRRCRPAPCFGVFDSQQWSKNRVINIKFYKSYNHLIISINLLSICNIFLNQNIKRITVYFSKKLITMGRRHERIIHSVL